MNALSRQQVRQVDQWAMARLGVNGLVLMENAGRQAADVAMRMLDQAGGTRAAIVAGSGNNGGDGFVLARHLYLRGAKPIVYLVGPPDRLTGDAAVNFYILEKMTAPIHHIAGDDLAALAGALGQGDLVIDAVGGTGITGALRGDPAEAVRQINGSGRAVLAIDIPTGLDCDTGEPTDPTVRANATVTFVARKIGFDNPSSTTYTGSVIVADIGVPAQLAKFSK
jgi:NAD(P)H-hydrate epimerase